MIKQVKKVGTRCYDDKVVILYFTDGFRCWCKVEEVPSEGNLVFVTQVVDDRDFSVIRIASTDPEADCCRYQYTHTARKV